MAANTADRERLREIAQRVLENPDDSAAFNAYLEMLPQFEGRYIVDGDQRMTRGQLRIWLKGRSDEGEAAAADMPELIVDAGGIWPEDQRTLTYTIARKSFAPEEYETVRSSLRAAAAEWVEACQPCDLQILHASAFDDTPEEAPVTFTVRGSRLDDLIALAFFPDDDPSLRTLHIDDAFFAEDLRFNRQGVMRHELGHILGYRHEHVRSNDPVCMLFFPAAREDRAWSPIEGFEAPDPASLMSYPCGTQGSEAFEFTQVDRDAHRSLYGAAETVGNAARSIQAKTVRAAASRDSTTISVEFLGAASGVELLRFLSALSKTSAADALPLRAFEVERGETACGIMEVFYGLTDCSEELISEFVATYNEGGTDLVAGGTFVLPDIEVNGYEYKADARASNTGRVDGLLGFIETDRPVNMQQLDDGRSIVTLRAKRAMIPVDDQDSARAVFDAFDGSDLPGASISVFGTDAAVPKTRYAKRLDAILATCEAAAASGETIEFNDDGAYWSMLGDPEDWPTCAQSCEGPKCPKIVLPDSIAHPQPDLAGVLRFFARDGSEIDYNIARSEYASCEPYDLVEFDGEGCLLRQFDLPCDHSTSMASIIASKSNKLGFVGLSPEAPVSVYDWEQSSSGELANLIEERAHPLYQQLNGPQLFVFASKFPWPRAEAGVADGDHAQDPRDHGAWSYSPDSVQHQELRDPATRLSHTAVKRIMVGSSLWITSAGHGAARADARPLSPRSPFAPMNLGDESKVIVVTACDTCEWPDISIDENANYGATDTRSKHSGEAVTIAAPGDGYLVHVKERIYIGPHGGTSQATAFVGGMTSAMLRCNADYYVNDTNLVRFERVKRRLILTSTPRLEPSSEQVPGVINPKALLKDPTRAWVRRVGASGTFREAAPPNACSDDRIHFFTYDELNDEKIEDSVSLKNTRRILRVPRELEGTGFLGDRWFIYTIPDDPSVDRPEWRVDVIGPVSIEDAELARVLLHFEDMGPSGLGDFHEILLPDAGVVAFGPGASQCDG